MRTKNESFSGEGGQMQRGTRDPKFSKYLTGSCRAAEGVILPLYTATNHHA